jgi:hypothetical protein
MKNLFLIIFFHDPLFLFSQNGTEPEKKKTEKETQKGQVDNLSFSKIYNSYLTETILGSSDLSTVGSFVSLDVLNSKLNLAVSHNWFYNKNKDKENYPKKLLGTTTFKFSGGIKEGTANIFKNEEYNTDISIGLEQSFILNFCGLTSFKYIEEDNKKLINKVEKLEKLKKNNEDFKALLDIKIKDLEDNNKTNTYVYYEALLKRESLNENDFSKKIENAKLNARWTSVRLTWLNLFANYGTQKLFLYDSNQDISNQITKITPENHELGLGLNFYYNQVRDLDLDNLKRFGYFLNGQLSLKYSYANTNNSAQLSTSKVVTETNIGIDVNTNRFIEESTNAYIFNKYDTFNRHRIAVDIIKKITNSVYFRFQYDYNEMENSDKYNGSFSNMSGGLVFGLKKKSDTKGKALVNFEVFSLFSDLGDKFENTGDEFYKRATIGLRTTIPFNNLF